MTATTSPAVAGRWVALFGNPNSGKTTLFNRLTGDRAHTANYPGITVERRVGDLRGAQPTDDPIRVVDLPGVYSLTPQSPDEAVAADVLAGRRADTPRPDVLVVVLDAVALERSLFAATQALELGVPTVIALNRIDAARKQGLTSDTASLARALGAPVVPVSARTGEGLEHLRAEVVAAIDGPAPIPPVIVPDDLVDQACPLPPTAVAKLRYDFIERVVRRTRPDTTAPSPSDRIDAVLTHRVWGLGIFVAVMTLVFVAIFSWAAPLMDAIDAAFAALGDGIRNAGFLGGGTLESLVVDGIVAGVGGVVIFLPQIMILFGFLTLLEDSGYLARAAFLMDRILRWCGLSGAAFVPLMSSFACAIPGIMACRSIRSRRERLLTILVAPLMSCSARIPVYTVLVACFVPPITLLGFLNVQGLVFTAAYLVGIVAAIGVAWLFRGVSRRRDTAGFLLELPDYKRPSLRLVVRRMLDRGWSFVKNAGTIILAASVIIWALGTFPGGVDTEPAERLETSWLGGIGRAIEPVVEPIGWDWRVGVAIAASFPARELVVGALGVIYRVGEDVDEESEPLRERIRAATWTSGPREGQPVFTLATALALMVFFALCAQCMSTLAVMWRETGSWIWPVVSFTYMTALAWIGAWLTMIVVSALGG